MSKYSKERMRFGTRNLFLFFLVILFIGKNLLSATALQDLLPLSQAAELLNNRQNPYLNEFFLNSFTLPIPFYVLTQSFSAFAVAIFWNLVNLSLIAFVIFRVLNLKNKESALLALLLVFASSPTRAMTASVQHTGLILGLIGIVFFMINASCQSGNALEFNKVFQISMPLVLAFEFKPQMVIPTMLLLVFQKRLRPIFWTAVFEIVLVHLALSVAFKMPLDLYWLQRLLGRSSETTTNSSRENGPWVILGQFTHEPRLFLIASFLSYVILTFICSYKFRNNFNYRNLYFIFTAIPLVLAYLHTYDLLPIAVICTYKLLTKKQSRGYVFVLTLLLLPTLSFSYSILAVLVSIGGLTSIALRFTLKDYLEVITAGAMVIVLFLTFSDIGQRVNIHLSLIVLTFALLMNGTFLKLKEGQIF